jgi:hypothetical protein
VLKATKSKDISQICPIEAMARPFAAQASIGDHCKELTPPIDFFARRLAGAHEPKQGEWIVGHRGLDRDEKVFSVAQPRAEPRCGNLWTD